MISTLIFVFPCSKITLIPFLCATSMMHDVYIESGKSKHEWASDRKCKTWSVFCGKLLKSSPMKQTVIVVYIPETLISLTYFVHCIFF